jgi:hypothetical protein
MFPSSFVESRTSLPIPIVILCVEKEINILLFPDHRSDRETHISENLHFGRETLEFVLILTLEFFRRPISPRVVVRCVWVGTCPSEGGGGGCWGNSSGGGIGVRRG